MSETYASLHKTGSLWKDEFVLFELDEIMRQRDDATFAELLCRVRVAACTENDITLLKSRVVHNGDETYPQDALHVYRKNIDVAEHNIMTMLNKLAPKTDHILIRADDDTKGQTRQISVSHIATATGGLPTTLILAKGAKVMLTVNVDVCDGLVNGARGIATEIIKNVHKILAVLVKLDNTASSQYIIIKQYVHIIASPNSGHLPLYLTDNNSTCTIYLTDNSPNSGHLPYNRTRVDDVPTSYNGQVGWALVDRAQQQSLSV